MSSLFFDSVSYPEARIVSDDELFTIDIPVDKDIVDVDFDEDLFAGEDSTEPSEKTIKWIEVDDYTKCLCEFYNVRLPESKTIHMSIFQGSREHKIIMPCCKFDPNKQNLHIKHDALRDIKFHPDYTKDNYWKCSICDNSLLTCTPYHCTVPTPACIDVNSDRSVCQCTQVKHQICISCFVCYRLICKDYEIGMNVSCPLCPLEKNRRIIIDNFIYHTIMENSLGEIYPSNDAIDLVDSWISNKYQ